jgi:hypothetical protein
MECFIKKIFEERPDEGVSRKFVRFGRGRYEERAVLSLQKTSKLKLKGGFEYANDFVLLVSELVDARFSGIVLSRNKIDLENEKKKNGIYSYDVSEIRSEKIREIADKSYHLLLDTETPEIKLKIKKRLPKPGKGGNDKFCQLEASLKFWPQIKEAFFWDVPECRKVKVEHMYDIRELIMPQDEKDFELLRLKTKRKGRIIRKLEIDGREEVREKEFAV